MGEYDQVDLSQELGHDGLLGGHSSGGGLSHHGGLMSQEDMVGELQGYGQQLLCHAGDLSGSQAEHQLGTLSVYTTQQGLLLEPDDRPYGGGGPMDPCYTGGSSSPYQLQGVVLGRGAGSQCGGNQTLILNGLASLNNTTMASMLDARGSESDGVDEDWEAVVHTVTEGDTEKDIATNEGASRGGGGTIRGGVKGARAEVTRAYSCAVCARVFKKLSHLKQHQRSHTGEKPYSCTQCQRSFVSNGVLKSHLKTHTGLRQFKCKTCAAQFTTNGSLQRHALNHVARQRFRCAVCAQTFRTVAQCKLHLRTHTGEHNPPSLARGIATSGGASNENSMFGVPGDDHLPECDRSGDDAGEEEGGTSDPHSGGSVARGRVGTRGVPNDTAPTASTINKSEVAIAARRRYANACAHCVKSFKKPSDLLRHVRTHTGEKPFKCAQCNRSFTVKSTLDSHIKTHIQGALDKVFKCPVCDAGFSTRGALKVHARLHTGARPFQCPHCDARFRTSGHRKSHVQQHNRAGGPRGAAGPRGGAGAGGVGGARRRRKENAEEVAYTEQDEALQAYIKSAEGVYSLSEQVVQLDTTSLFQTGGGANDPSEGVAGGLSVNLADIFGNAEVVERGQAVQQQQLTAQIVQAEDGSIQLQLISMPMDGGVGGGGLGGGMGMGGGELGGLDSQIVHIDATLLQHLQQGTLSLALTQDATFESPTLSGQGLSQESDGLIQQEGASSFSQLDVRGSGGADAPSQEEYMERDNEMRQEVLLLEQSQNSAEPPQYEIKTPTIRVSPKGKSLRGRNVVKTGQGGLGATSRSVAGVGRQAVPSQASTQASLTRNSNTSVSQPSVLSSPLSKSSGTAMTLDDAALDRIPAYGFVAIDGLFVQQQQQQQHQQQIMLNNGQILESAKQQQVFDQQLQILQQQQQLQQEQIQQQLLLETRLSEGAASDQEVVLFYAKQQTDDATAAARRLLETGGEESDGGEDDAPPIAAPPGPSEGNSPKVVKQHVCPVCAKSFRRAGNLRDHVATLHSAASPAARRKPRSTPHKCSECDKAFAKPSQLERHQRVHTGERPFTCEQCGKTFNQKNALQIHLKRHSGERPFQCAHCTLAFSQKGNLKTHVTRAHRGKPGAGGTSQPLGGVSGGQVWPHRR